MRTDNIDSKSGDGNSPAMPETDVCKPAGRSTEKESVVVPAENVGILGFTASVGDEMQ